MKLNRKIDLFAKSLNFGLNYLSLVGGMTSGLILGYINYYFHDMKDESSTLPILVTYVLRKR